jgi:hypothetical protein
MDRHFSEITQVAFHGLTEEQKQRVDLALSAAMFFAILERLTGNSSFIGPAAKIEPMYATKLRQLRALNEGSPHEEKESPEGEDSLPETNPEELGAPAESEE